MSKKNIFLCLIVMFFLTVMVMSVFGKKPESGGVIEATGLVFYDSTSQSINPNQDGVCEVSIKCKDTDKITYKVGVDILPENSTDSSLQIRKDSFVTYEEIISETTYVIDEKGNQHHSLHYDYNIAFGKNEMTSLYFYYNNEGGISAYKELRFMFIVTRSESIIDR